MKNRMTLLSRAVASSAIAVALFPAVVSAKVFISHRTTVSDGSHPPQDVAFYMTKNRMMIQSFEGLSTDPTNRWYPKKGDKSLPIDGGARQYIYNGETHLYSILDWDKREIAKQPLERKIADKVAFDKLITDKQTFKQVYEKLSATDTYGKVENGNGIWWCQLYRGTLDGVPTEAWVTRGVVQTGKKGWSNFEEFEPDMQQHPLLRYPDNKKTFQKGAMVRDYPVRVIRTERNGRKSVTLTQQVTTDASYDDTALNLPSGFKVTTMEKVSDFLKKRPDLPANFPAKFPWPSR